MARRWKPTPLEDILPDHGRATLEEFEKFCDKHRGRELEDHITRYIEKGLFFREALDAARLYQLKRARERLSEARRFALWAIVLSASSLIVSVLTYAGAWKP